MSPWLRLAHRWTVLPHQHSDRGPLRRLRDFEFFLQLHRDTWINIPAAGGHVPLPVGHLALIPPGLVHAWGHRVGTHIAVHADLHAQVAIEGSDMMERLTGSVSSGPVLRDWRWRLNLGGEIYDLPLIMRVDAPAWQRRFAPLLAQWTNRAHRGAGARLVAAAVLGQSFAEILAGAGRPAPDPLAALLAEAAIGPPDQARIALLARRAGMGETVFRARVRERLGRGPREHIEHLRLERAAYALRNTDLPISDIAAAAGYGDPFHFARAFRRVHGTNPSGFRAGQ